MPRKKLRDRRLAKEQLSNPRVNTNDNLTSNRNPARDRLAPLVKRMNGGEKASDIMNEVMFLLRDTTTAIPKPGGLYTFIYFAKTPNLLTDRYPIVYVEKIYEWGFSGVNMHLSEPRNYDFKGVSSPMYAIKPTEADSAMSLPLMMLYQLGDTPVRPYDVRTDLL